MRAPVAFLALALALGGCSSPVPEHRSDAVEIARIDSTHVLARWLPGKTEPHAKGGLDPLVPRQVVQVLDRLGITTGGVYTAPSGSGGAQTPWTSAIDAAGYAISGLAGTQAAPAIRGSDANTGIYFAADETFIGANNTEALRVTQAGVYSQVDFYTAGTYYAQGSVNVAGDLNTSTTGVTSLYGVNHTSRALTGTVGTPQTLTFTSAGRTLTTTGMGAECYVVLPDASDAGAAGTRWRFLLTSAFPLRISCLSGDVITMPNGTSTASGGYVRSTLPGACLEIETVDNGTYRATFATKTWAIDSTTSAGYAYTPTAWASDTPVTSWDGDADVTITGRFRQVGDTVERTVLIALTGAPPSATLTVAVAPTGYTVDSTKIAGYRAGEALAFDSSASSATYWAICYISAGNAFFRSSTANTAAGWDQATPITWATGDSISWSVTVPVQ